MTEWMRKHQTLVVVRQGTPSTRVARFVQSLNRAGSEGDTIKADVCIYVNGEFKAMDYSRLLDEPTETVEEFIAAVEKMGHEHDYTLCVPVFKPEMMVTDQVIHGLKKIAKAD